MKRIISLMLVSLGALFLLVTLISSFFPSHIRVSRAIDIHANPDSVSLVLKPADYWETVLPAGTPTSIHAQSDSTLHLLIKSTSAIQMAAGYQILKGPVNTSCSVQRYYDFYFDWYPWEKFSSLLVESRFGAALESELHQLKEKLE
ncbi:MAG: hypothetical protein ACK5BU_05405 [Bacteroidota bacterium]|jgi:hypothetical protein